MDILNSPELKEIFDSLKELSKLDPTKSEDSFFETLCVRDVGVEIEGKFNESIVDKFFQKHKKAFKAFSISEREISMRLNLSNVEALIGFYRLLNFLASTHVLYTKHTIHCHVDITDDFYEKQNMFINNKDSILEFLDTFKYTLSNNRRAIYKNNKFIWVNIRSDFNTIEFRMINPTFHYNKLIYAIAKLVWLVENVEILSRIHKLEMIDIGITIESPDVPLEEIMKNIGNRIIT